MRNPDQRTAWFKRKTVDIEAEKAARQQAVWQALSSPQPSKPAPAAPQYPKLTGRPGLAAAIAGGINTITSGPNTRAPFKYGVWKTEVRRGNGRDLRATLPGGGVADGELAPPTSTPEVRVGGIRESSRLFDLPRGVRVFNAPDGDLLVELDGDARFSRLPPIKSGRYEIR